MSATGRELEKKAADWIAGGYGGPVQTGLIVDLLAEVLLLKDTLEPFAHVASRFEEWGLEGEEVVLRIEHGEDVLTEIFTRPFIKARQAAKRLYP